MTLFVLVPSICLPPIKKCTLSLFCIFLMLGTAFTQSTLIHCGNVVDVNTNEMRPQMTIVVKKNKLTRTEIRRATPKQAPATKPWILKTAMYYRA